MDTAFGYWETLCSTNPGVSRPIFNNTRCDIMASNLPRCQELIKVCYSHSDPAICAAASGICWNGVMSYYDSESSYKGGRNRFDITAPCEMDMFCYKEMQLIQDYLNTPRVFKALGVPKSYNYSIANWDIVEAFQATNDMGISTQPQVLYLLENGIAALFYQGNLDLACNTAGNLRWASSMPWKGAPEFVAKHAETWMSGGKKAGWFKEVNIEMNGKMTRFSFVTHYGAGHMVSAWPSSMRLRESNT